ncbi:hypothetical protein M569_00664, partial [Genlisea aurea]
SPTVNLTREYTLALRANSYGEIRRIISQNAESVHVDVCDEEPQLLSQVLQPGQEAVREALSLLKRKSLARLAGNYFECSENASKLCLLLYQSVQKVLLLYDAIHTVVDDLPPESEWGSYSLPLSKCKLALDLFLPFDTVDNPFPSPDSREFGEIQMRFSQLRQHLDGQCRRRSKKSKLMNNGFGGLCCRATETGGGWELEGAAKGAFVIVNYLKTIERVVARLHGAVENDRVLIGMGVGWGLDRYSIQEVLKQVRRNKAGLVEQLVDLEEHLFLCFAAVNKARGLLLQEL